MAVITFYGKPNCINNRKQRDILTAAGHSVIVRDILQHPWTRESLYEFLKSRPFDQWFNRTAPAIKSGSLDPDVLSDSEALHMMLEAPILIKRPLLEFEGYKLCGFDAIELDAIIGLDPLDGNKQQTASLIEDVKVCPHLASTNDCDTLEKKAS